MPQRRAVHHPHPSEWLRNMVELSILFLMAVMVLRGFFLEGYLISTGSMAPGLYGLHKKVTCPSCSNQFAFGIAFDDSVSGDSSSGEKLRRQFATCPNCGQVNIDVRDVPSSHGDQLLVHKGVFDLRQPRRWETVVFRNPADPGEAYVKRVVGLPGETLQVLDGDLFIEGQIARKDLATARDMRIPVFDIDYQVESDEWQMPWQYSGGWNFENRKLSCAAAAPTNGISWIKFRNWRWSGGTHIVETPLVGDAAAADWKKCVIRMQDRPVAWLTHLEYDREREVIRLHGVLPYRMQQDLLTWADSEAFRSAVYRLGALSHMCPISDRYGYNSTVAAKEYPIKDVMLEADLSWQSAPDDIVVRTPVDDQVFRVHVSPARLTCSLHVEDNEQALRTADLPDGCFQQRIGNGCHLEVSNFDHRLIVAINGQQVFSEVDLAVAERRAPSPSTEDSDAVRAQIAATAVSRQSVLALGVRGGRVEVDTFRLFRDVYYTPGKRKNGVNAPFRVVEDGYFVQGDNSPVSSDSRNWNVPCVPHSLLVGKPFVVHLPSRPGKLAVGGFELPIRIPDFDRIRYIH